MKKITIILLLLSIFSCTTYDSDKVLDGNWILFEKSFIYTESNSTIGKVINIPGPYLNSLNNNPEWGSLKKIIYVKKGVPTSLLISGIYSASKVWIDGELYKSYGTIGKSRDSVDPLIKPDIVNFIPKEDKIEIVIEFSNFHLRENMPFKWIKIGSREDILKLYMKNQAQDYFSAGTLVIISIFFMLIFISNTKSKYNLYFSLFTLSYGIRSFFMEKTSIHFFIENFPWEIIYQLTKASELWSLATIILFFGELYPREIKSKMSNILIILAAFLSVFSFVPVHIFSNLKIMYVSHVMVLITGQYFIMKILKAVKNGRQLAILSLISIALFSLATVNDILSNRYLLPWGYYSAQVVIILVITMCILVSKERYLTAVSAREQERHNALLRSTFSKFVPLEILKLIGNDALEDRPPGDSTVKPQTIAYIDIRDYTKLSQGLTPEENFKMINDFFSIVGEHVNKNHGFIESYGGDGVKAIFSNEPVDAVNMALGISDEVHSSSKLRIGISIHFGQVVMGTIGDKDRVQAAAFSNVTRELNAMDHFNSMMGIEILISQDVKNLIDLGSERFIYLGEITLRGQDSSNNYYQIVPDNFKVDWNFKEAFIDGVFSLENKNYPKAYGYFTLAHRLNPSNKLTQYYINKLELYFKLKEHSFTLTI